MATKSQKTTKKTTRKGGRKTSTGASRSKSSSNNSRGSSSKSSSRKRSKRSSQKSAQPNLLERAAVFLLSPKILGLVLVAMSVFTVLSLMTEERGRVTGAWIDYLQQMVGLGAWGMPVVAGAIGIWLIIRAVEQMPNIPWQRPAGILLLFIGYLTGTALLSGKAAEASSGLVGSQTASTFVRLIGNTGAWIAVAVLGIIGLVMLTDRLLADAGYEILWRVQDWRSERGTSRQSDKIEPGLQPELPIPTGELPWWKRMRERLQNTTNEQSPTDSTAPETIFIEPETQSTAAAPAPPMTPPTTNKSPVLNNQPRSAPQQNGATQPSAMAKPVMWQLPALNAMLASWDRQVDSDDLIRNQGRLIQETLALFGVPTDFEGAYKGPSVTQYLIKPGYVERTVRGEERRVKVKVSKIAGLSNDLALALAAPSVRIEAPVPGTNYVGIEVPNHESNIVGLKELMESDPYRTLKGALPVALGEDVKGQAIVTDLVRMPHLLIAGSTGSGKSVCINSIVNCLLLTHTPDSLRFLMIDPKMVELNVYNGIPHLLNPVVTEIDRAAGVLFWAVKEMERRYQCMSEAKARDIVRYNAYLEKRHEKPLPYIVIVVDEMADLMLASPEEVEKHICRLAQMARAVGIHLIIATQRPSVDVITGLIKANFPARIAFAVSSQIDSRVILDVPGAERLLGRGDMLFMAPDASKLERLQGTYLSDDEIGNVVEYWKRGHDQDDKQTEGLTAPPVDSDAVDSDTDESVELADSASSSSADSIPSAEMVDDAESVTGSDLLNDILVPATTQNTSQPELFDEIQRMKEVDSRDELYDDAVRIVTEAGRGSVSMLQNKLRIGYGRSSRLVEQLERNGVLGPDLGGNKGRSLLVVTADDEDEQPDESESPVSPTDWGEFKDIETMDVPSSSDDKLIDAQDLPEPTTQSDESTIEQSESAIETLSAKSKAKQEDKADSDLQTPQVWM